jgi:hypothetical protein
MAIEKANKVSTCCIIIFELIVALAADGTIWSE